MPVPLNCRDINPTNGIALSAYRGGANGSYLYIFGLFSWTELGNILDNDEDFTDGSTLDTVEPVGIYGELEDDAAFAHQYWDYLTVSGKWSNADALHPDTYSNKNIYLPANTGTELLYYVDINGLCYNERELQTLAYTGSELIEIVENTNFVDTITDRGGITLSDVFAIADHVLHQDFNAYSDVITMIDSFLRKQGYSFFERMSILDSYSMGNEVYYADYIRLLDSYTLGNMTYLNEKIQMQEKVHLGLKWEFLSPTDITWSFYDI